MRYQGDLGKHFIFSLLCLCLPRLLFYLFKVGRPADIKFLLFLMVSSATMYAGRVIMTSPCIFRKAIWPQRRTIYEVMLLSLLHFLPTVPGISCLKVLICAGFLQGDLFVVITGVRIIPFTLLSRDILRYLLQQVKGALLFFLLLMLLKFKRGLKCW